MHTGLRAVLASLVLFSLVGPASGATPAVVITEIMYHPYDSASRSEDVRQEWIELLNGGTEPVNLTSWEFTDGIDYVFPEVTLEAGAYLVVAADVNVFAAQHPGVTNVAGGWTGWLSNSGERIRLADRKGTVIDSVTYADQGDWAVRELGPVDNGQRGWQWSNVHDGGGKSLELIDPAMPNEFGQNWAASPMDGGTPGEAGIIPVDDIAPMILEVGHQPVIPGPTDAVTVTARIVDEQSTGLIVTLHYRLDHSTYTDRDVYPQFNPGDYLSVPMLDDGAHEDKRANDGMFGGQIPAQQDRSIVEFYVEARDPGGRTRTWPAPSLVDGTPQQVTNALYQVDSFFSPAWAPSDQPIYYIIMTEMERGRLAYIGTHSTVSGPDSQMNATFISIDGTGMELRYNVGVRNRGHGTRNGPPNNQHVAFASDRRWKDRSALFFNCRNTPAQIVGSAIFRMAGFAAASATPVQLRINGVNLATSGNPMYGVYARLDAFDSFFAERYFPSDPEGNLYSCFRDNGEADLRYLGSSPEPYRPSYFKENNAAADDWSDLIHMIDVLNNAPETTYFQDVSNVINVSKWLRYIALDSLLMNNETGLNRGMGDDYFLYRGVADPRFVLIPHDLDTILDQGGSVSQSIFSIIRGSGGANGVDGLKRFFDHPDVIPLYHQAMLDVIDEIFNPEMLDPLFDQILGGFAPQSRITAMKQVIRQRTAAVLTQIPRQLTVTSPLPVADGYARTTAGTLALSGTADATRAKSVLVNGEPATWSAHDGTWQSGGALGLGESLVSTGSEWKYLDDGTDQGAAWREPGFDDGSWRSGRAELGYGDGGEATTVNSGPASNRYITTYFRRSFTASNVSEYQALRLRLLRDDGAVVYLNGVEVCRSGMPEGPVDNATRAAANVGGDEESMFFEYDVAPALLHEGTNLLAVEVHQNSPSSSDVSFDLALEAVRPSLEEGSLLPGINRIIVQSFDSRDGAGNLLEEGYIDIWYDAGGGSQISGTLASDKVLDAASGPWHVTSTVTVPAGVTLTIEPGATLFFHPGTGLTVNGRLLAEGTSYQRITLTKVPGSGNWAGLQFLQTQEESRLAYVNMEYCDSGSCAVRADHAAVYMDHVIWANHTKQYLTFDDASMVLKNSVLPTLRGAELVHHWGLPSDGYALLEGNWFGSTTGYNDIIDFTGGQRPDAIARFINNVFTGASDDCIDMDAADAHVEGNIFLHVRADAARESESHAVTTGTEYNQYSEVTVVRNLFYDVDHALLSKDGGFVTAVNNTIVHATHAAVNMYEPRSGQWQGKGFYGDGNIFVDVAHMFENPDWVGHATAITMNNSLFPVKDGDPVVWAGVGNLENVDAQLVRASNITDPLREMRLLPTSPALGTGPNGRDMGGLVPAGASIAGEPFPVTWKTSATLTVGGPDIFGYRYRVNDGPWSAEILRPGADLPADPKRLAPIQLANLQNGQSYTVYVIGKDSAGIWQDVNSPTASRTWKVDTSYRHLVISEVLAVNEAAFAHESTLPDIIELHYDGPAAMSLAGMSISDDPQRPTRYVFPAGVTMNPGEYLVLFADDDGMTSGRHLGFSFDADGDGVYLYDRTGVLVDSVEFGAQLPDLSIGRVGAAGTWHLTVPTLGQANVAQPLGDPRAVRINEWLAAEEVLFPSDFIELYNAQPLPVDLGNFYLTDTPESDPDRHHLRPLTFVPGNGYVVFNADDRAGPGHLGFKLSSGGDMIALFDAAFHRIDEVIFGPQTRDVSQGRSPDGDTVFAFFAAPTPGEANPGEKKPRAAATVTVTLVAEKADKRVLVPTGPVSDDWRSGNPFDDSAWQLGTGAPGGVGYEDGQGYESLITVDTKAQMFGAGKNNTCYIRIPFTIDAAVFVGVKKLTLKVRYDDGLVAYLNGKEVARREFTGTPAWNSRADSAREAAVAGYDDEIDISASISDLKAGDNLLAVQGMNSGSTSSDFLITVALDGVCENVENSGASGN